MQDALFILWIGLAAGLLLLFFFAACLNFRNRRSVPAELGDLLPSFHPVNLEVLNELVESAAGGPRQNPLTQSVSSRDQAQIQRQRIRKSIDCLRDMTHNAALLQRIGYSHLNGGNELISGLAQEMIDAGVHVRLYTMMGLVVLHTWSALLLAALPLLSAARIVELQEMLSSSLVPAYELLKNKADNLAILKFSSLHEALIQSL
jgi:hypothetical protein